MAKIIELRGIVGFDITAREVSEALNAANGSDVEVHVNSPGGFVFTGIEIYNLFRGYQGKIEVLITGVAASIASYFILAADKVTAYDNATYMIHNSRNIAIGDKSAMQKMQSILAGMDNIMANGYVNKTSMPIAKIKSLMDAETFYFGNDIEAAGFVDEIIKAPKNNGANAKDKDTALIEARASIESCFDTIRGSDAANADMDRAVAYMDGMAALIDPPAPPKIETPAAASGDDDPAGAGKKKQEDKDMTFEEYLAANPAAQATYDAAIAKARGEGIAEVRASIKATVEKVSPILSSEAYDKHTKDLGVAAITGEKSIDAFDAMVAVVDRENEKAKEAAAKAAEGAGGEGQGGEETPPHGAGGEAAAQAEYDAKKARLNVGEV